MVQPLLKFSLTKQQAKAWHYLTSNDDVSVLYGGARGGGKSHIMCLWAFYWTNHLIDYFGLKKNKNPLPVGFIGRKQGSDLNKTTLETWKKLIPHDCYEIRVQDHEIIIRGAAKIFFGGLDSQEAISKFRSAELAFTCIDEASETSIQDVSDLGGSLRLVVGGKRPNYKQLFTSNPSECWLKQEYIPPWGPAPRKELEPLKIFIPALPTDNPHLPQGYIERLTDSYKYDTNILNAMIKGDWNVLSGFTKLISLTDISSCFLPEAMQHAYEKQHVIAVDSARFGDDKTAIYIGENRNVIDREIYGKKDAAYTYGRIRYYDDLYENTAMVVLDLGGQTGAALYDDLSKVMSNRVIGIDFGGKSAYPERYLNKRAEMYGRARDWIKQRKVGVPRETIDLHNQLTAIEYDHKNETILRIAPKDVLKKMAGNVSPDEADAFVLMLEGFDHLDMVQDKKKVDIKWADSELNQPLWAQRNQQQAMDVGIPQEGLYT